MIPGMPGYDDLRRWQLAADLRRQIAAALRGGIAERHNEASGLGRFETAEVGKKAAKALWNTSNPGDHQEKWILEVMDDLFRAGLIHFGDRFDRCGREFFWMTPAGIDWLEDWQKAPENQPGYLADIDTIPGVSPIARSYLEEGQMLFLAGHPRAAAVLVGAVSEVTIYELRDALIAKLTQLNGQAPSGELANKKASTKRVFDAVKVAISSRITQMPGPLAASVDSHWPAFLNEVRRTRNDAGHPQSIASVQRDDVKAGLNQVRTLLKVAAELKDWIANGMTQ